MARGFIVAVLSMLLLMGAAKAGRNYQAAKAVKVKTRAQADAEAVEHAWKTGQYELEVGRCRIPGTKR